MTTHYVNSDLEIFYKFNCGEFVREILERVARLTAAMATAAIEMDRRRQKLCPQRSMLSG